MQKIIFVGSYMPQGFDKYLISLGTLPDFAGITFQQSLVKGLDYYCDIDILTIPYINSFPKTKKIIHKSFTFSHRNENQHSMEDNDKFLGLINLPFIKLADKFIRFFFALKTKLKQNPNAAVIIYGLHTPYLLATCFNKKHKNKTCIIIPDLPEYMSDNNDILYKIGKKIDHFIITKSLKKFNKFVLLSDQMRNRLPQMKDYIVIEGIYSEIKADKPSPKIQDVVKTISNEKIKSIMYAGGICKRYGVFDLLEAFTTNNDPNRRLLLCGGVEVNEKTRFEEYIKQDKRILYLGLLDKNDVRNLEEKVTLMINPRYKGQIYTKYSFPSKTMEYMASGTPTLMSHLEAIPKEYDEHLIYFKEESVKGISESIEEVLTKDIKYLNSKGKKAKEFIILNKNEKNQAKKIIEYINS